jgi:hypothetical protein
MDSNSVTYEMHTIDSKGLRNRAVLRDIEGRQIEDEDTLALARSGKKQILKVSRQTLHSSPVV